MTESFGARLRRQRERRLITLAHIASTTKIKASLFEGLERDDVSKWPAGIFRRSFVRAYAEAIGLDPNEVCREFVARFPEPGSQPAAEASDPAASRAALPSRAASSHLAAVSPSDLASASSLGMTTAEIGESADEEGAGLRLVLADQGVPLAPTPEPAAAPDSDVRPELHWRAVALDLGLILIFAITAFVIFDTFWMPLALISVVYYLASTLVRGSTPGVAYFRQARTTATPTSLDRALERRTELADATPLAARPGRLTETATEVAETVDSASGRSRSRTSHASIGARQHQPVDIESRRVRA